MLEKLDSLSFCSVEYYWVARAAGMCGPSGVCLPVPMMVFESPIGKYRAGKWVKTPYFDRLVNMGLITATGFASQQLLDEVKKKRSTEWTPLTRAAKAQHFAPSRMLPK